MTDPDKRPLPEDVSGHAMGPRYVHDDGRDCAWHHRLRLWVTGDWQECLRVDHPTTEGGRYP